MWQLFDEGRTIGTLGSEDGSIVMDEEHSLGGRITLERNAAVAPFAITCGIYGWMMHTRYLSNEDEAVRAVAPMKDALDQILTSIPESNDPSKDAKMRGIYEAIEAFIDRFPT